MKKYILLLMGFASYFYTDPRKITTFIPHYTIEKKDVTFSYSWGKTSFLIHAPKVILKIPYFFSSYPKDIIIFHPSLTIGKNPKASPLIFLRCLKVHHANCAGLHDINLEVLDNFKAHYKNFSIDLLPSKKFGWKGAVCWDNKNIGDFLLKMDQDKVIFYTHGKMLPSLFPLAQDSFILSGEVQNNTLFKIRAESHHLIARIKGSFSTMMYRIDYGKTRLEGDFSFSDKIYHFTISQPEYLKEKINFIIPKVSRMTVEGKGDESITLKTEHGYLRCSFLEKYFNITSDIQNLPTLQGNLSLQAHLRSDHDELDGFVKGTFDQLNFQGVWKKGKGSLKCSEKNSSIIWNCLDKETGEVSYRTPDHHMRAHYKREKQILTFPSFQLKGKTWELLGKGVYDKQARFQCVFDAKTLSYEEGKQTSSFILSFLRNYICDLLLKANGHIKLNIGQYIFNDYKISNINGDIKFKDNTIYTDNTKASLQDGVFTLQSSYNSEKLSFQITGKDFDLCPFFPSLEKGVAKNFTISGHTVKGQELCKLSADWTSEGEGIILNWNIFSHIPIEHMLCNGSIKNGILKGKTTKVVSPNLSMDARFVVNLVKNKISASLKGKVNQESFKTVLKGNLLNPEIIQQKK